MAATAKLCIPCWPFSDWHRTIGMVKISVFTSKASLAQKIGKQMTQTQIWYFIREHMKEELWSALPFLHSKRGN